MSSFSMTCISGEHAQIFSDYLTANDVDNYYYANRITVPWGGNVAFMMKVFEFGVTLGYLDDATASDEMCELL